MRVKFGKIVLVLALGLTVAACSRNRDPELMNITSSTQGPDEFAILPTKPLEAPEDYRTLPPPNPGGSNRVDQTPNDDAILALGGRPEQLNRGVPRSDGGLVSHASRYGVTPGIRDQLAAEDLQFRRRNNGRVLERLFNANSYFRAYRRQSLNQYSELLRFRRLGVRTPSAPPGVQ